MTNRLRNSGMALLIAVGAHVSSAQPRDGWHEDKDAWEFFAAGRLVGLVKAHGNQDPGGALMHASRFTPEGDLAHVVVYTFLGRGEDGMRVEKRHGVAPAAMNRAYKRALAESAELSGNLENQLLNRRALALAAAFEDASLHGLERETLQLPSFNSLPIDVGGVMPGGHLRLGPAPDTSADARFVRSGAPPAPIRRDVAGAIRN